MPNIFTTIMGFHPCAPQDSQESSECWYPLVIKYGIDNPHLQMIFALKPPYIWDFPVMFDETGL